MSLRSPLAAVLGSGSVREGTGHWWAQRVTAIALVLLGGWFLLGMLALGHYDYLAVRAWLGRPPNSVLMALLAGTLAYHSLLGVQVVVEDYVHGSLKLVSLVASKFAHIAVAAAAEFAILKIAFEAGG